MVVDRQSPLTSTCALEVPHQITHFINFHQRQHVLYLVLGLAPSSCFEKMNKIKHLVSLDQDHQ